MQLRNFGEAVPVVVVPRAVAVLSIDIKSRLTAVGDERGIGRGDVVVAAAVVVSAPVVVAGSPLVVVAEWLVVAGSPVVVERSMVIVTVVIGAGS